MSNYPQSAEEREATREQVGRAAHLQAIANRLSVKCAGQVTVQQHAGTSGGCANTGVSCLCECHDA